MRGTDLFIFGGHAAIVRQTCPVRTPERNPRTAVGSTTNATGPELNGGRSTGIAVPGTLTRERTKFRTHPRQSEVRWSDYGSIHRYCQSVPLLHARIREPSKR